LPENDAMNEPSKRRRSGSLFRGVLGALGLGLVVCSCSSEPGTLFRERKALDFENAIEETEDWNIIQYLYFYNGGGVAVGDVNNDGLPDVYLTANQQSNKLFLNRGGWRFEDVTQKAGVGGPAGKSSWTTGATLADVNADGWLDIYVCEIGSFKVLQGRNRLYINNQDGTFTERAAEFGLDIRSFAQQAAFFDYDRDGDLDAFLLNHSVHSTDTYVPAKAREERDSLAGDRLLRNDGGRFHDVSAAAGIFGGPVGYGLSLVVGDFNNDAWPDIFVGNDFHENDYLYLNRGNGTFTEAIHWSLGHTSRFTMGCDLGDIDNDGWNDLLTLDMKPPEEPVLKSSAGADPFNIYQFKLSYGYYYQHPRNMLHLNRGIRPLRLQGRPGIGFPTVFSEIGQLLGIEATDWSWSALIQDFDNDGRNDLFITNGIPRRPNDLDYKRFISNRAIQDQASDLELAAKMPPGLYRNFAFRNAGPLAFEDVSAEWGLDLYGCSNGAAWADFDGDGDLDLVVNNLDAPATLYENTLSDEGRHWLQVHLKGPAPNPFAVGARVWVWSGGEVQSRELFPVRGWLSSMQGLLHFGLGAREKVDSLWVVWPDGRLQRLGEQQVNQRLEIEYAPQGEWSPELLKPSEPPLFEDLSAETAVPFAHQENPFSDFNVEKLLPHSLAEEGPALAIADVNGDGLDDVFLGAAKGHPNALLLQEPAEGRAPRLRPSPQAEQLFRNYSAYEAVDALFFDADGDGDPDLYVANGGGEFTGDHPALQDQLFLNDGRGNFRERTGALPLFFLNTGCVESGDFNADGRPDLFVGGRSLPGSYGLSPPSFLLLNQGGGVFDFAPEALSAAVRELGMVTDAVWLPDSRTLAVVGEWMPLTLLEFTEAGLRKTTVPDSEGWWNALHAADLDGDGDTDLLAGNMGLNSNLRASPEEPVRLYVADYDNNLFQDPILTYFRQGREWIYVSKDELVEQLTPLRKKFVEYHRFAQSPFEQVFSPELLEKAVRREARTFASAWFENRGEAGFVAHALPRAAQFAPIYAFLTEDFTRDGRPDILAVGNFFENPPSIGRYDASFGTFLASRSTAEWQSIEPRISGFAAFGEARELAFLHGRNHRWILIAHNGGGVQVIGERKR